MKFLLRCRTLLFLVSIPFFYQPKVSGQGLSEKQIDSLAQKDMKLFQVPGLAIGVIKDGKLIYSKGFGVRSLRAGKPVTNETLFGIASNTKAFTAAALGLLVDEGKVDWDDKVIKYIQEFEMYDPYATREMTIRDLLCHRSGLATGEGDLMHDPDSTNFTVNDIIHNLRYLKPAYSFRSKFAYDNNLYLVAGEVIARVSKMPWERFVEQRILRPLKMDSSAASYKGCRYSTDIIDPHTKVNDTMRVVTRYTSEKDDAAGGVYSNVEDMGKWLLMLMNNGKYGDGLHKQLLTAQTVQQMWSPQTIIPAGNAGDYDTHFKAYGLGWFLVEAKGHKLVLHTGEDVGMVSEIATIPDLGLGVIVLTNNESNAIDAITYQIVDSYLGVTGTDNAAKSFARLQATEKQAAERKADVWKTIGKNKLSTPGEIKKYTGIYHDQWFGNITISLRNNRLWFASERSPQLRGTLYFYQKGAYAIKWQNPEIDAETFVIFNGTGKATSFTLAGSGFNFDSLLFKKL
jgi:CubicO group peptidase (beta-lactamase class C family)